MFKLPASRKLLLAVAAASLLMVSAADNTNAQQAPSGNQAAQGGGSASGSYGPVRPRVGGYSRLTLSDIWGPAKMPPPPVDFGPNFDFPPESLNGAPLHDPYPN